MYCLVYIVLMALVSLISYTKFKRVININFIFTGIWSLFGGLSCFGLYNMRKPDIKVHVYAWIFVVIVNLVIWAFLKNDAETVETNENYKTCIKKGKKVSALAYLLILPLVFKIVPQIIQNGTLAGIRLFYFSGEIFDSEIQDMMFRSIPMAMLQALTVYYVYVAYNHRKYKLLLISVFNTLLITLLNGGRFGIILLIYSVVIVMITDDKKLWASVLENRSTRKFKRILFLALTVMLVVTVQRGQSIIKDTVFYFSGSMSYLDYIVANPYSFALNDHTYGYLTFSAITEPIVLILKVLGITTAKVPSYEFNIYCQQYYNIGDGTANVLINANTTALYQFLRDFGFGGIIIGAVFIGGMVAYSYNKYKKGSTFWGLVFIYVCYTLFNSLMTFQFFSNTPLFMFTTFYLLTRGGKKVKG